MSWACWEIIVHPLFGLFPRLYSGSEPMSRSWSRDSVKKLIPLISAAQTNVKAESTLWAVRTSVSCFGTPVHRTCSNTISPWLFETDVLEFEEICQKDLKKRNDFSHAQLSRLFEIFQRSQVSVILVRLPHARLCASTQISCFSLSQRCHSQRYRRTHATTDNEISTALCLLAENESYHGPHSWRW